MKRLTIAAIGLASLASTCIGVTPAEAVTYSYASGTCTTRGQSLNISAKYHTEGAYHVWDTISYTLNGVGGPKSNIDIALYSNARKSWSWISGDNVTGGTHSQTMSQVRTLASTTEFVSVIAVFDTTGVDPKCEATTKNL